MFSQLGVTTGRKKKPSSLAMIEAQAAMLPQKKEMEEEKKMANKTFGLAEKEFAHSKEMSEDARFRAERAFEHQKEQEKKAQQMELANMGLTVLGQTGWGEQLGKAGSAIGKKVWGGAKDIVGGIADKVSGLFGLF